MTCAQLVISYIPQIISVSANNDNEALPFLADLQTRLGEEVKEKIHEYQL